MGEQVYLGSLEKEVKTKGMEWIMELMPNVPDLGVKWLTSYMHKIIVLFIHLYVVS